MYDSTYADMTTFASAATLASLISTYSMIFVAFYVLIIVAQWKIFVKAGQEGWKAIIPVIGWIITLALSIVSMVKLGKAFNQSTAFIFGLLLLSPIFQMILGFGKAEYVGNQTSNTQN